MEDNIFMTNNIWKLDWNPQGLVENFILNTKGKNSGDIISLKHSFFKKTGMMAILSTGQPLVVSENNNDADIILYNYNSRLSSIVGEPIYSNVKIQYRAVGQLINMTTIFIADILSSDSFGQDLHQNSSVEHYSIDTAITSTQDLYSEYTRVRDYLELPNGYITNTEVKVDAQSLELGRFSLKSGDISTSEKEISLSCSENKFYYKSSTQQWMRYVSSIREDKPVLSFGEKDTPAGSIPIVSYGDKSLLVSVDWLRADPSTKSVSINRISSNEIVTPYLHTNRIKFGTFLVGLDDQGNLNIGNSIFISKDYSYMKIGDLVLTQEKLKKLNTILEAGS